MRSPAETHSLTRVPIAVKRCGEAVQASRRTPEIASLSEGFSLSGFCKPEGFGPRPTPNRHLEVRVPRLQVVLRRDQRAVAELRRDSVGWQRLSPACGAAGAHIVEEAPPRLVAVLAIGFKPWVAVVPRLGSTH
jgi:hypothetical protein